MNIQAIINSSTIATLMENLMSTFKPMTRAEWEKVKARTTDFRTDILKDLIKTGQPVSNLDGNDLTIKNIPKNIKAIEDFLENKEKAFELELKDGKTVFSTDIGKSAVFGGQGVGQGMTGQTSDAEALQCIFIAAMLGEGVNKPFSHFTKTLLKSYKNKIDVDADFERFSMLDSTWHESGYVTAKALIDKGYVTKDHTLHMGSRTMKNIYAKKTNARKTEGMAPMQNDKWNPGDIWAVRARVDVNKALSEQSQGACNKTVLENFMSRDIVGISLKKINSLKLKAKVSEYNIKKKALDTHKYTGATLQTKKGAGIWTSKYGFVYFDSNAKLDVRAPNLFTALNMEIQLNGARGGRTGYSQIVYSSKNHLGASLPTNAQLKQQAMSLAGKTIPRTLSQTFYKMVKKIESNYTEADHELGLADKQGQGHFIHAVLGVTYILHALVSANTSQQNAFISEIVNVAGAKTNDSSAYVKVEVG